VKITEKEVRHVARLAELEVDDSQVGKLAGKLESIVTFVEQLAELGEEGSISDTVTIGPSEMPLRPDVEAAIPMSHPLSEFAPEMQHGFFVVPRLEGLAEE
jgi:aspartyl-tRNA(Asn)/glutamyl-tRNA(Gln) amidotransferase subunit C